MLAAVAYLLTYFTGLCYRLKDSASVEQSNAEVLFFV